MLTITLQDPNSRATARIAPELGLNCYSLQIPIQGSLVEILDAEPEFGSPGSSPTRSGIPLLFPFPNRIRDAKFDWNRKSWSLVQTRRDPNQNAIHGYVMNRAWKVTRQAAHCVVAEFQLGRDYPELRPEWPADFLIEVTYQLVDSILRCDIRIVNCDTVPLPWGFGTHAYFRVPLAGQSCMGDVLIQAPVEYQWETINSLPTGRRLPLPEIVPLPEGVTLAGLALDHVFGGLKAKQGRCDTIVMDAAAGIQVTQSFSPEFRDLVVFTPPHGRSVCLEPYTCINDAANLQNQGIDAGWQELAPGAEARLWFEVTAGLIMA